MGHKVNPGLLRMGYIKNWHSRWFAKPKDYAKFIEQDYRVRKIIMEKFKHAVIADVIIERLSSRVRVRILTARPGVIIGRHGADIERLREELNALVQGEVAIDVEEVKNPTLDANIVGQNVATQIEKRVAYRRAVKRVIEQAMNSGAKGIKITVSGRLGGAEMSRTETYKQGKIPLSTLRADINYGLSESLTTYGLIGIKVWIYLGDVLVKKTLKAPKQEVETEAKKESLTHGNDAEKSKIP